MTTPASNSSPTDRIRKYLGERKAIESRPPDGPYTQVYGRPDFSCPRGSLGTISASEAVTELLLDARNHAPTLIRLVEELLTAAEYYGGYNPARDALKKCAEIVGEE